MSYTRPPRRKHYIELPWAIIHHEKLFGQIVPARFSSRNGAEEYAKFLRRLSPGHHFEVAFLPYDHQ